MEYQKRIILLDNALNETSKFDPIQDGPFRGCSWMEGRVGPKSRPPSLKSVTRILH